MPQSMTHNENGNLPFTTYISRLILFLTSAFTVAQVHLSYFMQHWPALCRLRTQWVVPAIFRRIQLLPQKHRFIEALKYFGWWLLPISVMFWTAEMDRRQSSLLSTAVFSKFIRFQKIELTSAFQWQRKLKATSLIQKDATDFSWTFN